MFFQYNWFQGAIKQFYMSHTKKHKNFSCFFYFSIFKRFMEEKHKFCINQILNIRTLFIIFFLQLTSKSAWHLKSRAESENTRPWNHDDTKTKFACKNQKNSRRLSFTLNNPTLLTCDEAEKFECWTCESKINMQSALVKYWFFRSEISKLSSHAYCFN